MHRTVRPLGDVLLQDELGGVDFPFVALVWDNGTLQLYVATAYRPILPGDQIHRLPLFALSQD